MLGIVLRHPLDARPRLRQQVAAPRQQPSPAGHANGSRRLAGSLRALFSGRPSGNFAWAARARPPNSPGLGRPHGAQTAPSEAI
jgi:hypothetical protein